VNRRLAIIGAGGHGRVLADAARRVGWDSIVFFDDRWPVIKENLCWTVLGRASDFIADTNRFGGFIVAIGNPLTRLKIHHLLIEGCNRAVTVRHPATEVGEFVQIGVGTALLAGAIVGINSHIGDASIINTCASIDHDCRIGDGVNVGPGARLAGAVSIGDGAIIGVNATIIEGVSIGNCAIVGAGAVVLSDVPDGATAVGNPARLIR
jgi:sugar O-acyltransferase (sialic acid O-acetyltransferase NeuD family)